MASQPQDMPTFDHYAFNLRDGLRRAAVTSLTELEDSISDMGYGWLDGYMEAIMNRQNNAPITEYMKTPSRTQTIKKTRATTAAAKDRIDKVKGLNSRLALSPSTKQNTRMALSPLQPRSLNVSTLSPTPITSPKASPIKSKQPEKIKPKPKAKKGKSKKTTNENDENSPPSTSTSMNDSIENNTTSCEKSKSSRSVSSKDDSDDKSKSSRSKSKKEKEKEKVEQEEEEHIEEPLEEPMEVADEIREEMQIEEPIQLEDEPAQIDEDPVQIPAISSPAPEKSVPEDVTMVNEAEQIVPSPQSEEAQQQPAEEPETMEEETGDVHDQPSEPKDSLDPQPVTSPAEERPPAPVPHEEPERKVDPTMPTSFAIPTVTAGPSNPIRQVRSSWLSKALGANAVTVNGLPSTDTSSALRKSYAPSNQRQSTTLDLTGLRKSLAPINGLKRKSDHGVEEDEDEEEEEVEEKRPEKTAKVVIEIPAPNYTDALPARTPGPNSRPNMPSKTPSFGSAGLTSQPNSLSRSTNPSYQTDNTRSDIHRVTKALDELREKTAAKEAAKQKAALAASTGPTRVLQAKSTGTGFLRGLGNIGAGLLGLGGSGAEEEAEKLARELEEERIAEMALEKLMKKATQPEAAEEKGDENVKDMEVDEQPEAEHQSKAPRSTTPEITSSQRKVEAPMSPEEEEEMFEEQSVVDELIPLDPRTSIAAAQRQPSAPVEMQPQSTTPPGTPTRPIAISQASALHIRDEKHIHEPSAAMQKEKERPTVIETKKGINGQSVKYTEENKRDTLRMVQDDDATMADGEEDDDEVDELSEEEEVVEVKKPTRVPPVVEIKTHRKIPSSSSAIPTPLNMSTSSTIATGSVLGQAQSMAAKALGVKPATGPVKSLQMAAAAAKKEQAAAERKAAAKESEARRQLAAKNKAEEERARAEEERKAKVIELEEKRRARAEMDRRNKERNDKAALVAREKAEKERAEKEAQAAKLRAAEEEAARKRKIAAQTAALNKSQNKPLPKQNGSSSLASSQTKGKEPFRPSKQATLGSSTINGQSNKMGPSSFRTAEGSTTSHQTHSSTISLVTQNQTQNGERKALGPPSRTSNMSQYPQQPIRQSTNISSYPQNHVNVLQQSRVALQTQLDEKAAMIQSEDIVLPDIASEYSDSDDEDRTRDFIPPTWAESPQLRAALEAQAHRNPDELFGPIKPLNMEELFKVRTNKFRSRTSSANWSKTGDGLTKAEEVEYAKRMGFRPVASNLGGGGGGSGSGGFGQ